MKNTEAKRFKENRKKSLSADTAPLCCHIFDYDIYNDCTVSGFFQEYFVTSNAHKTTLINIQIIHNNAVQRNHSICFLLAGQ